VLDYNTTAVSQYDFSHISAFKQSVSNVDYV